MKLNTSQRAGLRMLVHGKLPHRSTLEALIRLGLVEGPYWNPKLTENGRYFEEHACLPPKLKSRRPTARKGDGSGSLEGPIRLTSR